MFFALTNNNGKYIAGRSYRILMVIVINAKWFRSYGGLIKLIVYRKASLSTFSKAHITHYPTAAGSLGRFSSPQ